MKTYANDSVSQIKGSKNNRREFINRSILLGTLAGVGNIGFITSCKNETNEGGISCGRSYA